MGGPAILISSWTEEEGTRRERLQAERGWGKREGRQRDKEKGGRANLTSHRLTLDLNFELVRTRLGRGVGHLVGAVSVVDGHDGDICSAS
jgi:hypothetical protein